MELASFSRIPPITTAKMNARKMPAVIDFFFVSMFVLDILSLYDQLIRKVELISYPCKIRANIGE